MGPIKLKRFCITKETTNTYLAGEIPWSWRWFFQGEAYPLHSGCADPCNFPKCGKLDCIICGSGGLRLSFPLNKKKKKKKGNHQEKKRQHTKWGKIFENIIINKGLTSKIYEQFIQLNTKKQIPYKLCL